MRAGRQQFQWIVRSNILHDIAVELCNKEFQVLI